MPIALEPVATLLLSPKQKGGVSREGDAITSIETSLPLLFKHPNRPGTRMYTRSGTHPNKFVEPFRVSLNHRGARVFCMKPWFKRKRGPGWGVERTNNENRGREGDKDKHTPSHAATLCLHL